MTRENETRLAFTSKELIDVPEEEIFKALEQHRVTHVRRIKRRVDNAHRNTPTVLVNFDNNNPPPTFQLNDTTIHLTERFAKPLICFKCLQIGHTRRVCSSSEKICYNCSRGMHTDFGHRCTLEKFCSRCKNNSHSIGDKICPEYKLSQKLSQIAAINRKPPEHKTTHLNQQATLDILQTDIYNLRLDFTKLIDNFNKTVSTLVEKIDRFLSPIHTAEIEELEPTKQPEKNPNPPVVKPPDTTLTKPKKRPKKPKNKPKTSATVLPDKKDDASRLPNIEYSADEEDNETQPDPHPAEACNKTASGSNETHDGTDKEYDEKKQALHIEDAEREEKQSTSSSSEIEYQRKEPPNYLNYSDFSDDGERSHLLTDLYNANVQIRYTGQSIRNVEAALLKLTQKCNPPADEGQILRHQDILNEMKDIYELIVDRRDNIQRDIKLCRR